MKLIPKIICALVLSGFGFAVSGQDDTLIGRVIIVNGSVQAERGNGELVSLSRRDEIHVGDKIITGTDGAVQIRFIDNAILSLSCASELQVREYQYLDRNSDRSVLELIKGQVRTVTGVIQRRNTRFVTARSEVRPAGTDYEVMIGENAEYFAVYDGNIRISTDQGAIEIGNLAQAQYARFNIEGELTQVPLRPAQLGTGALGGNSCE